MLVTSFSEKKKKQKTKKYCSRNINGHELECVLCVLPVGMLHSNRQASAFYADTTTANREIWKTYLGGIRENKLLF